MKTLACPGEARTIEARLSSLAENDARRWGKMNALETVWHVRESFRVASGEQPARPVRGILPPQLLKWISLRSPLRWPKNLPTASELIVDRSRVGSTAFEAHKAEMFAALRRFLAGREYAAEHPFFGAMEPDDWMRWAYLHTDHHLRQFGR